MDDPELTRLAEELAAEQAADEQSLAQIDRMMDVVRLGLERFKGISPIHSRMLETMAVMRAAGRMKAEAAREFLRAVDAARRGE